MCQIFLYAAEGWSPRQIAGRLNRDGIAPPNANRQRRNGRAKSSWLAGTIRGLLGNQKFTGDWTYNKFGWIQHPEDGREKHIPKPESEWEYKNRPELVIVQSSTWQAAQEQIERRKHGPSRKSRRRSNYLLTGLMRCHECGASYVVASGSKPSDPLFQCATTRERGGDACSNYFKVRRSEIEQVILRDIQEHLLSTPVLSAIVGKVNEKIKAKLKALKQSSARVVKDQGNLETQIHNIVEHISKHGQSDALQAKLEGLEYQIKVAKQNAVALNQAHDFDEFKVDDKYVQGWLFRMGELIQTDVEAANRRLESLIGEFTLTPETIDGIRYLKAEGRAQIDGLLALAAGKRQLTPITNYRGADLNCRPPVPQTGALTN